MHADAGRKYQIEMVLPFFLAAVLFFIPISPSLKSIAVGLTTALIFLIPSYRQQVLSTLSLRVNSAALMLLFVAVLACSWSVASFHHQFFSTEKYFKLIYIPLFAIGFSNKKTRMMGIHAFLLASLIVCVLSILKNAHLFEYKTQDPGEVFNNHIVTGYMMAFAAYLSGLYATRTTQLPRVIYSLLGFLFTYQVLFVNTGRTGYIVYFILLALLLSLSFSSKRQFILLVMFAVLLAGIVIKTPSVLSTGLNQVVQDFHLYKHSDKNTSVGYRLQFHEYAKSLFLSRPMLGYGTGGFKEKYHMDNPIPVRGNKLNDPHSQYWLIASEFGVLGLAVLAVFFLALLILSFQLVDMKPVLLGLLIPFFFANITDSFLINTGIGYLFVVFCAMCLGEWIENNNKTPKAEVR